MHCANKNSKSFGMVYSLNDNFIMEDQTINCKTFSEFKVDCNGLFAPSKENSDIVCGICDDNFKEMCSLEKHLRKEHWQLLSAINDDDITIMDMAVENPLFDGTDLLKEADKCIAMSIKYFEAQSLFDDSKPEAKTKSKCDLELEHLFSNTILKLSSKSEQFSCDTSSTSFILGTNLPKYQTDGCKPFEQKENISPENGVLLHKPYERPVNNKTPLTTQNYNVMEAEKYNDGDGIDEDDVNPELFCEFCLIFFETKTDFYQHASEKHDRMPVALQSDPDYLRCDYCLKTFYEYSKRIKHQKSFHIDTNDYECPHCPKTFELKSNRNQHIAVHHEVSVYWCDFCNIKFKHSLELRRHMDEVHYKK